MSVTENAVPSLLDILVNQDSISVPVIVTPTLLIGRRDLAREVDLWRASGEGRKLRGGIVMVEADSDLAAVLGIAKLDGWCDSMILLPRDIGLDQKANFANLVSATGFYRSDESLLQGSALSGHSAPTVSGSFKTKWIVPTSGTTGRPKLYAHTLASLTRTIKGDVEKGRRLVWGLLYDPFRFAGIQVVLQSLLGGSKLAITSHREDLEDAVRFFAAQRVNAISATPTLWRKLLISRFVGDLQMQQITLGGEIADNKILSALRMSFPNSRVVHIYASTEAGVGFAVSDGLAGFPVSYISSGIPSGGQLKVDENSQLLIRPPTDRPQAFSGETANTSDWIPTGDAVALEGERYRFCGRANGAINVGGNKVMPEEVEAVVRAVAGVLDVKVEGRASSITGQIVQAFVVPDSNCNANDDLRKEVLAACRVHLEGFKVPGIVRIVESLELTAAGKVRRKID